MRKIVVIIAAVFALVSSGSLMPSAMADEAPVVRHSKRSTIFVPVRTVAPMRPVEFGAVSSVLMGILAIRFTGPMGPMAEPDSGEPTPIPAGVIAE